MKATIEIRQFVNTDIKVGDTVRLIDGSGCTPLKTGEKVIIVFSYPKYTGLESELRHIPAMVAESGISNFGLPFSDILYTQDIIVRSGNSEFRTCSAFVAKIESEDINP